MTLAETLEHSTYRSGRSILREPVHSCRLADTLINVHYIDIPGHFILNPVDPEPPSPACTSRKPPISPLSPPKIHATTSIHACKGPPSTRAHLPIFLHIHPSSPEPPPTNTGDEFQQREWQGNPHELLEGFQCAGHGWAAHSSCRGVIAGSLRGLHGVHGGRGRLR